MSSRNAVCTIVARNYLASARTLCQSVRELHPELACYVLFTDDVEGYLTPADECFQPVALKEIGLTDLKRLSFRYDVVELATAVKPQFLKHLFQAHDLSKLIYLDPDILVLNRLDEIFAQLDQNTAVLTPHLTVDFPQDGQSPTTDVILAHGIYNLGFIALQASDESRRMLDWWDVHLRDHCTRDNSSAHFVDQKVMDLAPLLFQKIAIEAGDGYNVAFWNLHSRRITLRDGRWFSNELLLYFFHFSSYNPRQPERLSKHLTRTVAAPGDDVFTLCRHYAQLLVRNGYEESSRWPYQHGSLHNGAVIEYATRQHYRHAPVLQRTQPDPFNSAVIRLLNRLQRMRAQRDTWRAMLQRGVGQLKGPLARFVYTRAAARR